MGRVECHDQASDDDRNRGEKRPKDQTTSKDRLTDSYEDVHTYTFACTTNCRSNDNNSEQQCTSSHSTVCLHSFVIHSGMERVDTIIIIVVVCPLLLALSRCGWTNGLACIRACSSVRLSEDTVLRFP